MKHVYPPRHPAWLDDKAPAPSPAKDAAAAPPRQREIGRKAYGDAAGAGADTDRGPVMDQVYNEQVAPDRGPDAPRQ